MRLLRGGSYDLVLLIVSQGRLRARDAIARLRREAGHVPMVVLTEPGGNEQASVAGALASGARAANALAEALDGGAIDEEAETPWSWDAATEASFDHGRHRGGRGRASPAPHQHRQRQRDVAGWTASQWA